MTLGPGYQTPFSEAIRTQTGILTGAVGMITDPAQAAHILRTGQADLIFIAREFLRDPYWPLHAAAALGEAASWPVAVSARGSGEEPGAHTGREQELITFSTILSGTVMRALYCGQRAASTAAP